MASPDDEHNGLSERPGIRERVWRVEQRQADVFIRLDKIDARIDTISQRQIQRRWSVEEIERKIEDIEKGLHTGAKRNGSRFGDSELIRAVVYGLLALVAALAAGQVINFGGFGG